MEGHLVELAKRTPLRPKWRNDFNEATGGRGPSLTHPDVPGHTFRSNGALKKFYRLQRYNGNTLNKRSQHRIDTALRRIMDVNRIDASALTKSLIADRVARLAMPDTTDLSAMLEKIVREEVANALFGRTVRAAEQRTAKLTEVVREIALAETKRLVIENLSFDVRVTGDVFVPAKGKRATRVTEEQD